MVRAAVLLAVLAAASAFTAGCAQETGRPRPVSNSSSAASGPSPGPAARSIDDLALCELLTPADFPFSSSRQFPPKKRPEPTSCVWLANKDADISNFITNVGMLPISFSQYQPPDSSPNGRATEIAGRPAWVGTVFPTDVDESCGAVFGAADGLISMVLLDETDGHPDPCLTVVDLAEKVAERTPPPTGQ